MKITDARLEHPVLGLHQIQIQLTRDDGKTIGYAWPIKLGQTLDEFAMELYRFGDKLKKDYGSK